MALLYCVVCSRSSTRTTWNNVVGSYVACDFHTQAEILTAIANAGGAPATGADLINQDPSLDESSAS